MAKLSPANERAIWLAQRIAQCESKPEVLLEIGIRSDSCFEEATRLYRAVLIHFSTQAWMPEHWSALQYLSMTDHIHGLPCMSTAPFPPLYMPLPIPEKIIFVMSFLTLFSTEGIRAYAATGFELSPDHTVSSVLISHHKVMWPSSVATGFI
jgi:hypothetical protein